MLDLRPSQVLLRALSIILLAGLLVACGNGSSEQAVATLEPTAAATPPPTEVAADEEDNEGNQGNVVTRSVRTAGSWVWSGLTWVWDRGSGGVNAVWDAIGGVSSFLWANVSELPSNAWDVISSFWNWVWGTGIGKSIGDRAKRLPETLAELNPVRFFESLISGIVRVFKIGAIVVIMAGLLFAIYKFRLIVLFRGVFSRRQLQSRQRGSAATAGSPSEQRLIVEVQQSVPSVTGENRPGSQWSRAQIRELKARVSNPTVISLFVLAEQRDGGPVNYRELIQATGLEASQVGGHLSSFFRKAREIHKDEEWPIRIVSPTDEHSNRAYFVPQPYLDWWFEK